MNEDEFIKDLMIGNELNVLCLTAIRDCCNNKIDIDKDIANNGFDLINNERSRLTAMKCFDLVVEWDYVDETYHCFQVRNTATVFDRLKYFRSDKDRTKAIIKSLKACVGLEK